MILIFILLRALYNQVNPLRKAIVVTAIDINVTLIKETLELLSWNHSETEPQ